MQEFQVNERTISGYLALPEQSNGTGIVVLHAWWGLTEVFQQVCDRLAKEGFVAFAPDLYHGKSTSEIEEAGALSGELDPKVEQWRGDITDSVHILRQHVTGKIGLMGFSLGGGYALDMSVRLIDDVAAVVIFYDAYPDLDYSDSNAAYLLHFAEDDPYHPIEVATAMRESLQQAGKPVTVHIYPDTQHWFVEENRPEYNAQAARVAWERTLAFLHEHLG